MRLGPDTYAVLRNTAALEAHRQHQRLARRAGQPFLALALVFFGVVIAGVTWGLLTGLRAEMFRIMVLPLDICIVSGGACFALAGLRIRLWLSAHPEASAGRPRRQAGL